MTNNPFPSAAPNFSDPLGLLRACHDNIFRHCEMVERLAGYLAEQGPDQPAHETAAKILRYFSTAAKHHHADEEEDLFPRLSRHSQQLAATIQHLKQEHQQLDQLWQQLEPLLSDLTSISDNTAFGELTKRFAETYRCHAEKENADILEQARDVLSDEELKQIGRAMAERRGVALPTGF